MKITINKVSHGINLTNQLVGEAIQESMVVGHLHKNWDYHSDNSWVDLDSLKEFVRWQYEERHMRSIQNYEQAMSFLNNIS